MQQKIIYIITRVYLYSVQCIVHTENIQIYNFRALIMTYLL